MRTPRAFLFDVRPLIDLSFEQENGSTTIRDHGSAGCVWTVSGATQQTTTVLDGSASLSCAWGSSHKITTPWSRHIALGPTDDFEIEIDIRATDWNNGGAGKSFLTVGGTGVASDTVFILSTSASDSMHFSVSNGSAFGAIATAGGVAVDNTRMRMAYQKRGSFMGIQKDGGGWSASASGTFSGRIANYPAALMTLGVPYSQFGTPTIYYDRFRYWRYDRGQRDFRARRNG